MREKNLSVAVIMNLLLVFLFAVSAAGVTRARESRLHNGWQIWIEACDFDRRDESEILELGEETDEKLRNRVAEPVLGEDFVIAPRMEGWMEYDFVSSEAGDAYIYPRIMDYRGGGQSWFVMLNTEANGQATPFNTPGLNWSWRVVHPAIGQEFVPSSPTKLRKGTNTVRITPRETDTGKEVLIDIICVSTKEFGPIPTDDDWKNAKPLDGQAVQAGGKLATMWGIIKSDF